MSDTTGISTTGSIDKGRGSGTEGRGSKARRRRAAEAAVWRGPVRRYDILKEATVALVVVLVLTVVLAVLFSSPDVPPVTLRAWASAQPKGFTEIALSELDGTSTTATYGPPYNHSTGSLQDLYGVSIQKAFGVTDPIDPGKAFVLDPLGTVSGQPALTTALHRYEAGSVAQRSAWLASYGKALTKAAVVGGRLEVPVARDGPVATMMSALLAMARSGGLDAALVEHSSFYTTNYTDPILFLGDSAVAQPNGYWNEIVTAQHLQGSQWGLMNETGSWPGQPWLWLYTMWYQIGPMSTSNNGDVEVIAIMTVCSLGLLLVPFIPGLRDIPRLVPVHRLIWKDYYRSQRQSLAAPGRAGPSAEPVVPGGEPPPARTVS
jgi:hypothetical protein